ncbi:YggS family pyridoxal phosphate-dependent enzyme [Acholeplasma vituli]|uniref:YggS family pyridoxal phosphate-dependent enzyme n=2 Tax=Paracholeplasma vituli TaxID=69473 RepID=A0ABT2PV42_9MOLU|nr:YggS family pyridoxal phosphate-dependent enzyme [Paracholeplasma vituli]
MSKLTFNTQSILKSVMNYPDVTVVCASKYVNALEMREIFQAGVHHFGENHAQVLLEKKALLRDLPITWHFIGHLQTNKVKKLVPEIDFLHSLDSLKLAKEIQKYRDTPLSCFIELNVVNDPNKTGLSIPDLPEFLLEIQKYDKIKIVGFMAMGVDQDLTKTQSVFETLKALKEQTNLPYVSMGMTDDYPIALAVGTNFVRIGRKFIL